MPAEKVIWSVFDMPDGVHVAPTPEALGPRARIGDCVWCKTGCCRRITEEHPSRRPTIVHEARPCLPA